ncbi:hypothetical protein [Aureispira anguillae]|uniref:Uncharacterized protein n=1 Tax=Aureispira anguillae TaxID=2864201 RepID=A0A915YFR2_9BACT|nr:hypothetical protein [Aureispira anguillae]BDS12199.1 hypothetical protein AsAng_0029140 [Aureispira anguillae]
MIIHKNSPIPKDVIAQQTSSICEPSLSQYKDFIFVTGNWFAAQSEDNGTTWEYISPYSHLPKPPNGGQFDCDQTTIASIQHHLLFWILQYDKNSAGNTNVLRLAVKNFNHNSSGSDWYWWDFSPCEVNQEWDNEWFDYNHAVVSDNYLYIGTNVFSTITNQFTRFVVLKFSLKDLANAENTEQPEKINSQYIQNTVSPWRATQGAHHKMFFASHNNSNQLQLLIWDEHTNDMYEKKIAISPWNDVGHDYSDENSLGRTWLNRCDDRVTGAWFAKGVLGFMWTANHDEHRPYPFIRVVRIKEEELDKEAPSILDEPDIWNEDYAYAYPDAAVNQEGDVGITLFRGGPSLPPSHCVGILDSNEPNHWLIQSTVIGTHFPRGNKWGDYLACRPHPDGKSWIATGFTLQDSDNENTTAGREAIEPRIIHFSKSTL